MTKHRLGFLWRSLLCGVCLAGLCSLTAPLQAQDGWDDEEEMTEGEDTMVEMVPWAESERKKEMERKHRSARIVLMQEEAIASAVNAGGDLVESARAYIQNGRDGAQRHHGLLYAINALALAGGLLGLLSIPGSFEKTRRRLLLVLPIIAHVQHHKGDPHGAGQYRKEVAHQKTEA